MFRRSTILVALGFALTATAGCPGKETPTTPPSAGSIQADSRAPIINAFDYSPKSGVSKSDFITFTLVAKDPGGQDLQLNWTSTKGRLTTNTGSSVGWQPMKADGSLDTGVATITVIASNGKLTTTGSVNIQIGADGQATVAQPPVIQQTIFNSTTNQTTTILIGTASGVGGAVVAPPGGPQVVPGGTGMTPGDSGQPGSTSDTTAGGTTTGGGSGMGPGVPGAGTSTPNPTGQFVLQTSGTNIDLNDVCFPNLTTGYAVGGRGTIIKTTDSGMNWASVSTDVIGINEINCVYFVTADIGWVGDGSGDIFKTTDGGASWTKQSKPSGYNGNPMLTAIKFIDVNTGYVVGTQGVCWKTINGGTTWAAQTTGETDYIYSIAIVGNTVWISGRSGIFQYSDGVGWVHQSSIGNYNSSTFSEGLAFVSALEGWRRSNGKIFHTTNGGSQWQEVSPTGTNGVAISLGSQGRIAFSDSMNGYALANGGVFVTVNGGSVWQNKDISGVSWLNSIYMVDSSHGWVVGNSGKIVRYIVF
jgi:photosystem II stability/assembly factor-like uncharacterized protein